MQPTSPISRSAAPGKVILFGEHAVVHGRPAIAAALSHGLGAILSRRDAGRARLHIPRWGRSGLLIDAGKESTAPKDAITRSFFKALSLLGLSSAEPIDITIDGELPLGVGLGSSAAFTVALLRVLSDYAEQNLSDESFITLAHELESIFHGTPSGLDHSVIIHNACARFVMGSPPTFEPIKMGVALPVVVGWLP
ncbi:MAG: mevalonate kinase family protein, partial [Bradymonadia bacterium]